MKNFNQSNLISGDTKAQTPEVSGACSSDSTMVETVMNPQSPDAETPKNDDGAEVANPDSMHDQLVERLLDRTLERLADKIRQAEEQAFRRAIDTVRQNPAEFGICNSVPNFLADVRRDVWES